MLVHPEHLSEIKMLDLHPWDNKQPQPFHITIPSPQPWGAILCYWELKDVRWILKCCPCDNCEVLVVSSNFNLCFFLCVFCRAVGRWLTNITPLLPLFTSQSCTLKMKHPSWEMPWKPSLDIRLSDHIKCRYNKAVKTIFIPYTVYYSKTCD